MLVVQRFLHAIDIFPGVITSRLNYNGKTTAKSSLGGCGTVLYIIALVLLFYYYLTAVLNGEKDKMTSAIVESSPDQELLFKDVGTMFMDIGYGRLNTIALNRTILDVFVEKYSINIAGIEVREVTRYEVAPCKGKSSFQAL